MDIPLATNNIGIRCGFKGYKESPQRSAQRQTLADFLCY